MIDLADEQEVVVQGVTYRYSAFYERLELHEFDDGHSCMADGTRENPAILCPECHRAEFRITYGNYECIANCACGHTMTIYDG